MKLDYSKAQEIRYLNDHYGWGSRSLAKHFHVGRTTIRHVLSGATWKSDPKYRLQNRRGSNINIDIDELHRLLYDDLLPLRTAASQLGCSISHIYRLRLKLREIEPEKWPHCRSGRWRG